MAVEYRIVRDEYCGYEVQWKHTWFPIWLKRGNTHMCIEQAEKWAERHATHIVKYIGVLRPSPETHPDSGAR